LGSNPTRPTEPSCAPQRTARTRTGARPSQRGAAHPLSLKHTHALLLLLIHAHAHAHAQVHNPPNAEPLILERVVSEAESRPNGPVAWMHTKVGGQPRACRHAHKRTHTHCGVHSSPLGSSARFRADAPPLPLLPHVLRPEPWTQTTPSLLANPTPCMYELCNRRRCTSSRPSRSRCCADAPRRCARPASCRARATSGRRACSRSECSGASQRCCFICFVRESSASCWRFFF
jgi:hypothetical protein